MTHSESHGTAHLEATGLRELCRRIAAAFAAEQTMFDAPLITLANALASRCAEIIEILDLLCELDGYFHFHVQGTESQKVYAELKQKAHQLAQANRADPPAAGEPPLEGFMSLRQVCQRIDAGYAAGLSLLDPPLVSLAQELTSRTPELVQMLEVLCGLDDHFHFSLKHIEVDETFAFLKNKARLLALSNKGEGQHQSSSAVRMPPLTCTLQHTRPSTEALMQMIIDYGAWVSSAGLNADHPGTAQEHRERAELFLASIREALDGLQRRACPSG